VLLGVDHLVIAVRDPDTAAATLEADVGLACTGGGRHDAWGTFNRLAFLGDTYVELIGVFDRGLASAGSSAVARATLERLDAGLEGLATYALATDDLASDVARLRAAGSLIGDVRDGSRARPDGAVVRWRTAAGNLGPDDPPFLIEHEASGAEWDAAARAARSAFVHPLGAGIRLAALELPVPDPAVTAARYASAVGVTFDAPAAGPLGAVVGGQAIRLRTRDDGYVIVELRAADGASPVDVVRFGIQWRCA
jgi:hypothetical protein